MKNFDDVVLTLENDRLFHDYYHSWPTSDRSIVIIRAMRRLGFVQQASLMSESDMNRLLWYFNDRYFPDEKQPTAESETITTDFTVDKQPTLSKENSMSSAFFVTKHFVNGQDVATLPKAQVYGLIAAKEGEIANLEKIQNKPKSLVREIEKSKADIKALVDLLDGQEPAEQQAA